MKLLQIFKLYYTNSFINFCQKQETEKFTAHNIIFELKHTFFICFSDSLSEKSKVIELQNFMKLNVFLRLNRTNSLNTLFLQK